MAGVVTQPTLIGPRAARPRPWPAHVRETACYTWERTVSDAPAIIGEPLTWR